MRKSALSGWVRLQAARSDRSARNGIALATLNSFIFVGIFPLIIGLSALVLFPAPNGVIPEQLQDGAVIFTVLMKNYAPIWLNIFLAIGQLSGAAIVGAVATSAGGGTNGYQLSFGVLGFITVAILIFALRLRRSQ